MTDSHDALGLEPLSPRQRAVLQAVQELHAASGRPPTRAELGSHLGVRPQTADFHLRALERKSYLELGRSSRSIRLKIPVETQVGAAAADAIPILGRVAAGPLQQAIEHQEGSLPRLGRCPADYALKVQGDSMIEAGILDGDLILVQQAASASAGEIVVALVGSGEAMETTVKRYLPQRDHVVLRAENPAMGDLVVRRGEPLELAGRVVGVLRWWR